MDVQFFTHVCQGYAYECRSNEYYRPYMNRRDEGNKTMDDYSENECGGDAYTRISCQHCISYVGHGGFKKCHWLVVFSMV